MVGRGAWGALIVLACEVGEQEALPREHPVVTVGSAEVSPVEREEATTTGALSVRAAEPIVTRISSRILVAYAAPTTDSAVRGTIPRAEPFFIHEHVDGPDCEGEGWGRVDAGGHVCLEHARPTDDAPRSLPVLLDDEITPFYYARLQRKRGVDAPPPASRWRSRWALYRGDPPEDVLEADHDYAFVARKYFRRVGPVLVDDRDRAIKEREVRRLRPSTFSGRRLDALPPPDRRLAWAVTWPQAPVHDRPRGGIIRQLDYHQEIVLRPKRIARGPIGWYELEDGGFVDERNVRYWAPAPPPAGLAKDEIWIDVELGQQTLALIRAGTPLLVTLVAAGNLDNPTPPGLFRIRTKQAHGDMRSSPEEEEDVYDVEGVPWVQYFAGRYALHGTYWHGRFGRRTSHGCVNLSPLDAAYVHSLTSPVLPAGWISIHEHADDPGTLVRIRLGDKPVPDRRAPMD
jgi:hypothetical protein